MFHVIITMKHVKNNSCNIDVELFQHVLEGRTSVLIVKPSLGWAYASMLINPKGTMRNAIIEKEASTLVSALLSLIFILWSETGEPRDGVLAGAEPPSIVISRGWPGAAERAGEPALVEPAVQAGCVEGVPAGERAHALALCDSRQAHCAVVASSCRGGPIRGGDVGCREKVRERHERVEAGNTGGGGCGGVRIGAGAGVCARGADDGEEACERGGEGRQEKPRQWRRAGDVVEAAGEAHGE